MYVTCALSGEVFDVSPQDLAFYERMSPVFGGNKYLIPPPTLSPSERLRRRLSWRNERKLYRRKCDLCKRHIISIYQERTEFPVYCPNCWWGDGWSAFDYGQVVDLSESFFLQVANLQKRVPRISLVQIVDVNNSDYTHDVARLQDCYLVFDGEQARQCCHGETFVRIADCFDFLDITDCELCYEIIACANCYNLKFSHNCFQCSDSWFLRDCRGCKSCYCCANLHQKEYYIFNKPHSRADYEAFIAKLTAQAVEKAWIEAKGFWASEPVRYMRGIQNEDVTGDYVSNSKDVYDCYNVQSLRDCRYCTNMLMGARDCYDVDIWGHNADLLYECVVVGENIRELMGDLFVTLGADRVYYSQYCSRGVRNLFGCIGLSKAENCILNKQYSAAEYEKLVATIITKMAKDSEWGEYLPSGMSPFAYNETVAQEYLPLSRQEVIARGLRWHDEARGDAAAITKNKRAHELSVDSEEILAWAIECEDSGRLFRLQQLEVEFYRKTNLPIPRFHPDIRHQKRTQLRNPRRLWERECGGCSTAIVSSYSPDRPEQVLCNLCYQGVVD